MVRGELLDSVLITVLYIRVDLFFFFFFFFWGGGRPLHGSATELGVSHSIMYCTMSCSAVAKIILVHY